MLQSLATVLQDARHHEREPHIWNSCGMARARPRPVFRRGKQSIVRCRAPQQQSPCAGNDLSINFGANGITSLLTETGVSGTGKPTTNFGDGWYALGIDTTGGNGPVFWEPFFRLFGSATGDTTVTGPYTAAGTDAYVVYNAEGETGTLLNADVDGSGAVNSKDLTYTAAAKGDTVARGLHARQLPGVPVVCWFGRRRARECHRGHAERSAIPAPAAIDAWQAAGLDPPTCESWRACRSRSPTWARPSWAWKPAV